MSGRMPLCVAFNTQAAPIFPAVRDATPPKRNIFRLIRLRGPELSGGQFRLTPVSAGKARSKRLGVRKNPRRLGGCRGVGIAQPLWIRLLIPASDLTARLSEAFAHR